MNKLIGFKYMSLAKKLWHDIISGENLDVYATISSAFLVCLLNIFNLVAQEWLSSITLAILAILAVSGLVNRNKLDILIDTISQSPNSVFLKEFPKTLVEHITRSKEVIIIGNTLHHTVSSYYALLENKLKENDEIKILVMDPKGSAYKIANERVYRPIDENSYQNLIYTTLLNICTLKSKNPGKIDIKVIDQTLPFGFFALDIQSNKGIIYIEHYPIKQSSDIPKMILTIKDGYWYEFFKDQVLTLWNMGRVWEDD